MGLATGFTNVLCNTLYFTLSNSCGFRVAVHQETVLLGGKTMFATGVSWQIGVHTPTENAYRVPWTNSFKGCLIPSSTLHQLSF